jgi:hypothetical protein
MRKTNVNAVAIAALLVVTAAVTGCGSQSAATVTITQTAVASRPTAGKMAVTMKTLADGTSVNAAAPISTQIRQWLALHDSSVTARILLSDARSNVDVKVIDGEPRSVFQVAVVETNLPRGAQSEARHLCSELVAGTRLLGLSDRIYSYIIDSPDAADPLSSCTT